MNLGMHTIFVIILSLLLFTNCTNGKSTSGKAAIIFSGHEFFHEGKRLRQSLIEKDYDVHLTEVDVEKKGISYFDIEHWSKTPLVKSLEEENYKQLLLIVTAHGHHTFGANIKWTSLLKLIKLLEEKVDEIFIHLETCHSGDAAVAWLPELGNKVKVFTTSSCDGRSSLYNPTYMEWNLISQIFTGYYLDLHGRLQNASKANFELMNCNSTVSDLDRLFHTGPCGIKNKKGCINLHVHRGQDEKLEHWNILPINLTVRQDYTNHPSSTKQIPFSGHTNCGIAVKPLDHERTIEFEPSIELGKDLVNRSDPISKWKLRVDDIPIADPDSRIRYFNYIPKRIIDKQIEPYSMILKINGKKCDEEGVLCTRQCAEKALDQTSSLLLGHYDVRKIWILDDDSPYKPTEKKKLDEKTKLIIIICSIIGAGIIVTIVVYSCRNCQKKKRNYHISPYKHQQQPQNQHLRPHVNFQDHV